MTLRTWPTALGVTTHGKGLLKFSASRSLLRLCQDATGVATVPSLECPLADVIYASNLNIIS